MQLPPQFVESGFRLNRETARTGGIRRIASRQLRDGSLEVEIFGILLPPIPRKQAPNYNNGWGIPTGRDVGLPDYELSHLWGPGFGDEAWDGLMYAPRELNQDWLNRGIEQRLRDLRIVGESMDAVLEVTARANAYPLATWRGHSILRSQSYDFALRHSSGASRRLGRVELTVSPPPQGQVDFDIVMVALP